MARKLFNWMLQLWVLVKIFLQLHSGLVPVQVAFFSHEIQPWYFVSAALSLSVGEETLHTELHQPPPASPPPHQPQKPWLSRLIGGGEKSPKHPRRQHIPEYVLRVHALQLAEVC